MSQICLGLKVLVRCTQVFCRCFCGGVVCLKLTFRPNHPINLIGCDIGGAKELGSDLMNTNSVFNFAIDGVHSLKKRGFTEMEIMSAAVSRTTCQNLLGLCGHAVHSLLFWQQGQSHDTPYYPRAREERICEHHFSRIKDRFRGTPSLKQGLLGTFRTHLTQMKGGIPSPERFGVLKLLDFFLVRRIILMTHQERYRVFKRLEKRMS